jgi:release factor glutamine methyltransferase
VTVLEVIQRSTEFLAKKGVDSPRLQTELLLAHQLKLARMQLYLDFERVLMPTELDAFRELVKRRGQREPLQQIVGSTSFCGVELAVNRHVLVPRPETELLAEHGWTFLNQRAAGQPQNDDQQSQSAPTALDFGTGSGCLAIILAAKAPNATVFGVDHSAEALELARQNALQAGVGDRIQFFRGDGFEALPVESRFDLIISNPPYIPTAEIETLEPEVREYEPRQALNGGADGLDFYRRLALEAASFLRPGGKIMLEFGDGQAPGVQKIFESQNWIVEAVHEDYTRRPRILMAYGQLTH